MRPGRTQQGPNREVGSYRCGREKNSDQRCFVDNTSVLACHGSRTTLERAFRSAFWGWLHRKRYMERNAERQKKRECRNRWYTRHASRLEAASLPTDFAQPSLSVAGPVSHRSPQRSRSAPGGDSRKVQVGTCVIALFSAPRIHEDQVWEIKSADLEKRARFPDARIGLRKLFDADFTAR